MTKTTAFQQYQIQVFIRTARCNGIDHLSAALPSNHHLMVDKKIRQIRKVNGYIASGLDELGNFVILTPQGVTKQLLAGEI